jgi:hypothetical protein
MTGWQTFWGQIALHSARCPAPLRTYTDRDADGLTGIIAWCPSCWWHAVVLLRPGDYPLDDAPAPADPSVDAGAPHSKKEESA